MTKDDVNKIVGDYSKELIEEMSQLETYTPKVSLSRRFYHNACHYREAHSKTEIVHLKTWLYF